MSPRLSLSRRPLSMVLTGTPEPPPRLGVVGGRSGRWTAPVCTDIARRIMEWKPSTEITDELRELLREQARQAQELRALAVTPGEERDGLYPRQVVGSDWLLMALVGILADEQGSGKTVITCDAMKRIPFRRGVIVCSDRKRQEWADHVRDWTEIPVEHLAGDPGSRAATLSAWDEGILICNFTVAQMHADDLAGAELLVVDEAHKLRNRKTNQAQSLLKVAKAAEYVWLLTATPTVNTSSDVWQLLRLCDPDRFRSYWSFAWRFCHVTSNGFGLDVSREIREEEQENLQSLLDGYVLSRTREEVTGGSLTFKVTTRIEPYHMTGDQARLYAELSVDMTAMYRGERLDCPTEVAAITRKRQVALDPGLIWPNYDGPSKADLLVEIVQERDVQQIIFTHYADHAGRITERLHAEGVSAVELSSRLSSPSQQESLDRFHAGEAQVLVATHGIGGEGLNLVEASRVIFSDLAWHAAGNQHARDRVIRPGQRADEVEIILVRTEDSIEEHVWDLVREKGEVSVEELVRRERRG